MHAHSELFSARANQTVLWTPPFHFIIKFLKYISESFELSFVLRGGVGFFLTLFSVRLFHSW